LTALFGLPVIFVLSLILPAGDNVGVAIIRFPLGVAVTLVAWAVAGMAIRLLRRAG
jgi:hypothetical protein